MEKQRNPAVLEHHTCNESQWQPIISQTVRCNTNIILKVAQYEASEHNTLEMSDTAHLTAFEKIVSDFFFFS
jgi:hypothetical protein